MTAPRPPRHRRGLSHRALAVRWAVLVLVVGVLVWGVTGVAGLVRPVRSADVAAGENDVDDAGEDGTVTDGDGAAPDGDAEGDGADGADDDADGDGAAASASATAQAEAAELSALETRLRAQLAGYTATYSVTVRLLTGSEGTISIDGTTEREPASSIKVMIAWAALHEVDAGRLALTTSVGGGNTVSGCLTKMIEQSDNDCSVSLRLKVGSAAMNTLWQAAGFAHTRVLLSGSTYLGKATATDDLAELYRRLYAGTALSASSTELLLGHLTAQVWRTRIPAGVPGEVVVADKPGWLPISTGWTQSDSGIVYAGDHPYVLSVLGEGGATEAQIAAISATVYAALVG
jgi:beta-lactamase class A